MAVTYTTRTITPAQIIANPVISFDLGAHWEYVNHVATYERGTDVSYIIHDSRGVEHELEDGDRVTTLDLARAPSPISPWQLRILNFEDDPSDESAWMQLSLPEPMTRETAILAAERLVAGGGIMRAYVWHEGYTSPAVRLGWIRMDLPNAHPRHHTTQSRRCEANARKGTGTGVCYQVLSSEGLCSNASRHIDA